MSTVNNHSRGGDHDPWASEKMRRADNGAPGCAGLRSFDYDSTWLCDECALPVIVSEWVRGDGHKETVYVRGPCPQARGQGLPVQAQRGGGRLEDGGRGPLHWAEDGLCHRGGMGAVGGESLQAALSCPVPS